MILRSTAVAVATTLLLVGAATAQNTGKNPAETPSSSGKGTITTPTSSNSDTTAGAQTDRYSQGAKGPATTSKKHQRTRKRATHTHPK